MALTKISSAVAGSTVATTASPTFTGLVTLPAVTESVNNLGSSSGTIAADISTYAVFYAIPAGNFSINITNMPALSDKMITATFIIQQGVAAYMPTSISIGGSAQTVSWPGGSMPSGTATKTDIITLSFYYNNAGSLVKIYGGVSTYG